MNLTQDNYYSVQADLEYFSTSQFKGWRECGAKQQAILKGEHEPEGKEAFLFGQYVDTCITEPHRIEEFKDNNPELFSTKGATKGQLKSTYKLADACVERIEKDEAAMGFLHADDAEHQKIITGEINGFPWRAMLDVFVPSLGVFVDLKTTKTLGMDRQDRDANGKPKWWYDKYWIQMAVYRWLLRQYTGEWYEPMIIAVSKQDPPALRPVFYPDDNTHTQQRLEQELTDVMEQQPQFYQWRREGVDQNGVEPIMCLDFDNCEYCREHVSLKNERNIEVAQ